MKVFWVALSILLLFGMWTVHAVEIPTNVTIDNDPYISSISLTDSDGGTLQVWANDSRIFNCTGTAVDLDGFADISNINATIYGPSSNMTASDASGLHYTNASCTLFGGSANTTSFNCGFIVHHQTQPGLWTCNASINDSYARVFTNATNNTVDIFKSIAVPLQTIAFGAFAHSQNSGTTDKNITVNNTGNVKFNVTLDAYRSSGIPADNNSMSCVVGTLPVSSVVFAITPGVSALSKTALNDTPTTIPANVSTTAFGAVAPIPFSFYLGIVIPASGQGGACNGFLDVSAS